MPGTATQRSRTPDGQRDEWRTELALFRLLDAEFGFQIDVAATAENALCSRFYTQEDNALVQPWFFTDSDGTVVRSAWCNPPFSMSDEFLQKGRKEILRPGITDPAVVFLLRADAPETQWWTRGILDRHRVAPWLYRPQFHVRYLIGRTYYRRPDGTKAKNVNFPSLIVVMGDYAPGAFWWDWKAQAQAMGLLPERKKK